MKNTDLQKMSKNELESRAVELKNKVQDLRLQKFMGGEMNTGLIRTTKRDLARVYTFLNQKQNKK